VAADADFVERSRKHIQAQGIYGRVSVERSSFRRLPCADNLVNLLVGDDLSKLLGQGLSR